MLSRFGTATLGVLASLEINPLIVNEKGATAVDLLLEPVTTEKLETVE